MERVLGKSLPPPPPWLSLGNPGRHSGQETIIRGFPKVLGSENADRGSTQNFAARLVSIAVGLGSHVWKHRQISSNAHFLKMDMYQISRIVSFLISKPSGCFQT